MFLGAQRNVSFSDDTIILKFFTKGFEIFLSIFLLIPKNLLSSIEHSSACSCIYSSCLGSFIQTFTIRWQVTMVLLLHTKQILILVRAIFVKLIYLSVDLYCGPMVSAPLPIILGGLKLKICQNFVGTKFFLRFVQWINLYVGS